jgi:hypothetical protein
MIRRPLPFAFPQTPLSASARHLQAARNDFLQILMLLIQRFALRMRAIEA